MILYIYDRAYFAYIYYIYIFHIYIAYSLYICSNFLIKQIFVGKSMEIVWRLTGMNIGVLLHIAFLVKTFSTIAARERSGIAVDQ